jgi:hypothetical protein
MENLESCSAFIADVRSNMSIAFTDTETLGRITLLFEGDYSHVLEHLPELLETTADKVVERILKGDDE